MTLRPESAQLDSASFRALYQRHAGQLTTHFEILLKGRRSEAEDIVQEAFCLAWDKRHTLRDIKAFGAWVNTIARNVMLGKMRANTPIYKDDLDPAEDTPSMERRVDASRTLDRLKEALNDLPTDQREAVLLVRIQGMKFREAAETLNCAEATIKTRVRRGLIKLADILDL